MELLVKLDGEDVIDDSIINALGEPYYQSDYGVLYNMDCAAGMELLPPHAVDLTFTSPPYNIGKEYEDILSLEDYIEWSRLWMSRVYDVTAPYGSFWLNVGYLEIPAKGKCVPLTYLLWDKTEFFLQQEIVWNYGAGVASKKRLSPRNEKILWFTKDKENYTFNLDAIRDKDVKYPNQKKNGKLRCNTLGKNPSDVWQIAKVTSGKNRSSAERAPHPAQTPTDLIKRILLGGSDADALVLDPFMGSGSTAVACVETGRKFIGFEIRPDYCETTVSRVRQAVEAKESRLPL